MALAMGAKTKKMFLGHRGANHPVKNLKNGLVEITSQNHGFEVSKKGLPSTIAITHTSLFDGGIEGIKHKTKKVFSVQYHPESSPGPHDSYYLFREFIEMIKRK
jgi:carbamoyl-phosphate synthase small subunit